MKRDPVSPTLREEVITRDLAQISGTVHQLKQVSPDFIHKASKALRAIADGKAAVCMAPMLDQSQWGLCSGYTTLQHVKDEPMMGKRAPSDRRHLLSLCERHHLHTVAGANWATSHLAEQRAYLRRVEGLG